MNKTRGALYIGIVALLLAGAILEHFQGQAIADALVNVPGLGPFIAGSITYVPDSGSATSSSGLIQPTNAPSTTASSSPAAIVVNARGAVTSQEIISLTNMERGTTADLPPLTENSELDAAAEAKLTDMFKEQYFAHISPNGTGPSDLAGQAGYEYVVEGENLAEGNFNSTQDIINAWMVSPGHRANILNVRYMDIGAAVGEGEYQGHEVWMAVQEFGKPLSSCPAVDTGLHDAIVSNQTKAATLGQQLDSIKQALYAAATGTPDENTSYNQIADHYNSDVDLYNGVVTRLKAEIVTYNKEVEAFNTCVNG